MSQQTQTPKKFWIRTVRFPNVLQKGVALGALLEEKSANQYIVDAVIGELTATMEGYVNHEKILRDNIQEWQALLETMRK